jgi:two-component system, LytTR family, sensor histidine kinase AlgZ
MHPILSHARHLAVYLLAWVVAGVLVAIGVDSGNEPWWVTSAIFVPAGIAYSLVCLSTWYLCRAFPLSGDAPAWRGLSVHALASGLASSTWVVLGTSWAGRIDRLAGTNSATTVFGDRSPVLFVVGALLYWLAVAVHYLLIAVEASREAGRRVLEQQVAARESELKALRAQIDPHFMFNSLHSISALTTTDPAAARRMCMLLADFLRETLRLGAHHRITLADEFALADRFLAIEQIRFGARLKVNRRADADVGGCLVPPLILQPLVENAVVHGVAQLVEGGTIDIAASRTPTLVTITLENPCDPDRPRTRGVGLGLQVLRQRIATQFGVADAVHAAEHDGRYRVELHLPVETTP